MKLIHCKYPSKVSIITILISISLASISYMVLKKPPGTGQCQRYSEEVFTPCFKKLFPPGSDFLKANNFLISNGFELASINGGSGYFYIYRSSFLAQLANYSLVLTLVVSSDGKITEVR